MINSSVSKSVVSSSDLIDAKLEQHQLCGSKQCPGCGHSFEGKLPDWMGLPAGVKFDPTNQELIEHLEAKVEAKDSKSHPLIDEFIPSIEGEDGICYTHPEKLPGVARDGLSRHFFHRPSKAYTTGTRKRRKIQNECNLQSGETRWHKTGKTRPVMVNGKQKGCKKILVLYTNFGKNRKPEKTNWVMHQYHLGQHEEEKDGELVVSKIFYQTQPRQSHWSDRITAAAANVNNECSSDPNSRGDSGSGSTSSSSKEIVHQRDEMSIVGVNPSLSSYAALDILQLKSEHFSFATHRKSFDEMGIGDASTREVSASGIWEAVRETNEPPNVSHEHLYQQQQHHHSATAAFQLISRPMHPISTIISPPPPQASIIFDDDSYSASRVLLRNENFQRQQQHQHLHYKLGVGKPASGLEELIMGCCTSTDIKEASELFDHEIHVAI